MTGRGMQTWLAVAVVGLGVLVAAGVGSYVWVTNPEPLHPDRQAVPTTTGGLPAAEWAGAVHEAREAVLTSLVEQRLPGLSVAVGLDGHIVWAEGFGWADIEEQVRVTPDTRFRIGTASMALTSAGVGVLLEQGRLALDEPIRTYVPAYPEQPWPVTLRQLMGHLGGVRNDAGDEGPLGESCARTLDGLKLFAEYPLLFEPGTRFRVSSFGWVLVSAAVEAAAGEPFLTFMRRQVFEPLGMDDTRADAATDPVPNRATSYFPRFAADPRYGLHLTRTIDYSCYAGSNVFVSTASDLVRFGMATQGDALLRPATVELLQTSQRLASGDETGYGLGWDRETVEVDGTPARWVGHSGTSMGGMVSSLLVFPDRGLVVAVLSNIAYADTEALAVQIARAFAAR